MKLSLFKLSVVLCALLCSWVTYGDPNCYPLKFSKPLQTINTEGSPCLKCCNPPIDPKKIDSIFEALLGNGFTEIPSKCIENAAQNAVSSSYIKGCDSRGRISTTDKPPCIDDNYVKAISSAFQRAMKCIGLPSTKMYGIFARESHFQINIDNGTSVPVCQLDSRSLGRIEKFDFIRYYIDHGSSECQSDFNSYVRIRGGSQCERMQGMLENPGISFLYCGALYRYYQDIVEHNSIRDVAKEIKRALKAPYEVGKSKPVTEPRTSDAEVDTNDETDTDDDSFYNNKNLKNIYSEEITNKPINVDLITEYMFNGGPSVLLALHDYFSAKKTPYRDESFRRHMKHYYQTHRIHRKSYKNFTDNRLDILSSYPSDTLDTWNLFCSDSPPD